MIKTLQWKEPAESLREHRDRERTRDRVLRAMARLTTRQRRREHVELFPFDLGGES